MVTISHFQPPPRNGAHVYQVSERFKTHGDSWSITFGCCFIKQNDAIAGAPQGAEPLIRAGTVPDLVEFACFLLLVAGRKPCAG